jgi:exopolysaccharide biosynthesis polyprenyl glycosylphosphotransferase
MLKEKPGTVSGIARAVDLATIASSFAFAGFLCRGATHIEPIGWLRGTFPVAEEVIHQYAILMLTSVLAWIAVSQWRESYRSHRSEHLWPFLLGHFTTEFIWALSVGFLAFLFKLGFVSREFLLTFLPFSTAMLTARQLGARASLQYVRVKGHNIRKVIVLGDPVRAREFSRFIEIEASPGYRIVQLSPSPNIKLNGNLSIDFDEAFLTLGYGQTDLENTVLKLARLGKRVHIVPGLFDGRLFRQNLEEFAGVPVLSVGGHGVDPIEAAVKRLVDIAGSAVLLIVLSPALLLSALLVKCKSRGPILFSQERLGKDGRRFRMLKFRTMYRDAEERLRSDPELYRKYLANNHKVPRKEDPRVAPFGEFLRASSLDELPQLFNVLKGDMSLVGPRPITPPQLEQYGEYSPLFLSAKPGITGYWQVNGRSEVTDFSQRTELDIEYIRDQSFKTDVDVLLKTIPAVLLRRGAH